MCGIAGLISTSVRPLDGIEGMARAMRHRGPDDEGYLFVSSGALSCYGGDDTPPEAYRTDTPYRPVANFRAAGPRPDGSIALGHRRLAILDLSPLGHQPMSYAGRYWIIYNGEIYNYLEIGAELQVAGHQFLSHTDTEVILAAYAQWGPGAFSRFNGMWALAIYDSQTGVVVLSRDRFGVKPLYFWETEQLFAFASEIKAFTGLDGWRARANGQAVHDFLLSSLQDHSRETMFAGVFQLEPGTCATIDCRAWRESNGPERQRAISFRRFYRLQPAPFDGDFEAASRRLRELMLDSVTLRLRSDVPVGSCLSGGLDSSSIVCAARSSLIQQGAPYTQQTFSACSEIKRFDEREFIHHVVDATGVKAHYCFPTLADLLACKDLLTWHQDEPFGGTSIYAQWCVFRQAHGAGIKVMLDGQGADELLFGYHSFFRAYFCGLVGRGEWGVAWREMLAKKGSISGASTTFARAATDAAMPFGLQRFFRRVNRRRSCPEWLARDQLEASFPGPLAAGFRQYRSGWELSIELLTASNLPALLHWEDRNSMAHSIESRVPFLDYRLAEFVLGLPEQFKIRNGVTKSVLREAMKGNVPDPIVQRRDKMAFVTPEEIWARQTGPAEFRQALAAAVDSCQGILTPKAVPALERAISGQEPYDSAFWRMINLGIWVRKFGVSL